MAENPSFDQIVSRFVSSMYALRVFSQEIGGLAEEHDQKSVKKMASDFLAALGISPEDQEKIDFPSDFSEKKREILQNKKEAAQKITSDLHEIFQEISDEPKKVSAFLEFMKSLRKTTPMQSLLLRQGALINLLICFETLISDLIHKYYSLYPAALPSDDRLLSLSELKEIGSIQEAEKWLIDREVDAVLRDSTKSQIEYINKRPKVDTKPLNVFLDEIVEISQRRNIYVHNRGLVNKVYLNNVSKDMIERYKIEEGESLEIEQEYLSNALDAVYLCGIILTQQCWRKWVKEEREAADTTLASFSFDALSEERYDLTINIAGYAENIEFEKDRSSRIIAINRAIALKQSGRQNEIEVAIKKFDWSSCALEFQVALLALRNKDEEIIEILPRAISAGSFSEKNIREWPLFKEFRSLPIFEESMQKLFFKDYEGET